MITKFIGAAYDLNKVTKLSIVYTDNVLIESNIPSYTLSYGGYEVITVLDKLYNEESDSSIFKYEGYKSDFKFNAIIFYSPDAIPVGFTMLNQTINTAEFKIQSIQINLAFTIDQSGNRYIDIDLDNVSYSSHVANTSKVHKKLFSKPSDYAMTYSEISKLSTDRSDYSDTLSSGASGDSRKVVRYAGDLMIGNNRIDSKTIYCDNLLRYTKLIKINGIIYLFTWDNSGNLLIYKEGTYVNLVTEFSLPGTLKIGSNLVVSETEDKFILYKSEELVSGNAYILSEVDKKLYTDLGYSLRTVYDLVNHYLYFYRVPSDENLTGVTLDSTYLSDIADRLGMTDKLRTIKSLVGVSNGIMIYYTESGELMIKSDIPVIGEEYDEHYLYRDKVSSNTRLESESIDTRKSYPIRYINNEEGSGTKVNNSPMTYPFEVDSVELISSKSIIVRRSSNKNWVILEIRPKELNGSLNEADYELKSYTLGTTNNWRRLDLISRNKVNPMNLDILFSPLEGRLWRIEKVDLSYKITAL